MSDPVEDGDLLARMGTDAQKWAQEFIARFGGDEGLMIGWFANAIEAGRDAERERIQTGVDAVWTGICGDWRNPDQCDVCGGATTILAVIDGGRGE